MKTLKKVSKVTESEFGLHLTFPGSNGRSLSFDEIRKKDKYYDELLFRLKSAEGVIQSNSGAYSADPHPFSRDEVNLTHLRLEADSIYLSNLFIYSVRGNALGDALGISEDDLTLIGVPAYFSAIPRVTAYGQFNDPNFYMDLELYTPRGVPLLPVHKKGTFYSFEGDIRMISPLTHALIERVKRHKKLSKTEEFKSSVELRRKEYAEIRADAVRVGAQLDSWIQKSNVIFLESLPIEAGRDLSGRPVIAPVLPWFTRDKDRLFQQSLERDSVNDVDLIKLDSSNDLIVRVVFSNKAKEEYKFLRSLKGENAHLLEDVVDNPEKYFSSGPRVPVSELFSDRIAGFILGKPPRARSESNPATSWNAGFDEQSLILRTGRFSAIKLGTSPLPEEYKFLKKSYEESFQKIDAYEETLNVASGYLYTPLPPQLEKGVMVPELGVEVSLSELHNVCRAIEIANIVAIPDEHLKKAVETIELAKSRGELVVDWIDSDGNPKTIPTQSLLKSIPSISTKPNDQAVSPEVKVEIETSFGVSPNWSWRALPPDVDLGLSKFKPGIKLKAHQRVGYAWLKWLYEHRPGADPTLFHPGALLADDMGLGKTIQTLSLVTHVLDQEPNLPVLVVAPVSLIKDSWGRDAIDAFLEKNSVKVLDIKNSPRIDSDLLVSEAIRVNEEMRLTGKPFRKCEINHRLSEQIEQVQEWCAGAMVFSSYETLRSKSVLMASLDYSLIVLDEAQKIKSIGVLQTNAAKALKAKFYVAMTGTPIENSLMDLWSIMDFVTPGHLGDQSEFRNQYVNPLKTAEPGTKERAALREKLERELEPIWLRRTKEQVFKDTNELPPIHHYDSQIDKGGNPINPHAVVMSREQQLIYDQQLGIFNSLKKGHRLAAIRALMEICSSPWLSTDEEVSWSNHKRLFEICPKLEKTFQILQEIHSRSEELGRKVIIFANTIKLQTSLAYLIAEWHLHTKGSKIEVEVYNGEASPEARSAMLRRFKDGKGFQVIIISPKAGGAGLNIVESNNVIHYTREWNPALENQATARCYRIGQTRAVHVYYPTTCGTESKKTAEEHLAEILRRKRDVINDFTVSIEDLGVSESDFETIKPAQFGIPVRITFEKVATLDPTQFELLVGLVFKKMGYKVDWVGQANDRGADLVALSAEKSFLIQAKHTQKGLVQHTEGVNEIRGAHTVYEQKYGKSFELAVVTNGTFSDAAASLAAAGRKVELFDRNWLRECLDKHECWLSEIDQSAFR